MRPTMLWLILIPLVLAACAPRVSSKKGVQAPVAASAPAAQPEAAPAPAPTAQVAAAPAPAPVAETPPPAWKPAGSSAGSAPVASADPAPEAEESEDAPAAAPSKPTKRTYYGYSDAEIAALRKQSAEFKKLENQLKACTAKSTEAIERREEIPVEIAKIRMSKGGLTPQKEKKIEKLKAEQARLKSADHGACGPLEDRLTAMLQSTYDSESALY